jgi:hypothetical protein
MALKWHEHEQGLRRGHHAANGVHGKLLHHAVDGRGKQLQPGAFSRLLEVMSQACGFALGVGEITEQRAAVFALGLGVGLGGRSEGGIGFAQPVFLYLKLLLIFDQDL